MLLATPRLALDAEDLASAPALPGIYALWNGPGVLYVGRTTATLQTLKQIVEQHLLGYLKPTRREVSHFSYELSLHPELRHFAVIAELTELGFVLPNPADNANSARPRQKASRLSAKGAL